MEQERERGEDDDQSGSLFWLCKEEPLTRRFARFALSKFGSPPHGVRLVRSTGPCTFYIQSRLREHRSR